MTCWGHTAGWGEAGTSAEVSTLLYHPLLIPHLSAAFIWPFLRLTSRPFLLSLTLPGP